MHRNTEELDSHLRDILAAPSEQGRVEMIVRRPGEDEREVIESGELDAELGLVGDNWKARGSTRTEDGGADRLAQLTLMNARAADAVAVIRDRWPLCGDQIYVDLDLSTRNLPAGTRLAIGSAIVEVSTKPHAGCGKFAGRFGPDALRFVNFGAGKENRLRGANAFVIEGGSFAVGDVVKVTRG